MMRILEWANAEGREQDITPELREILSSAQLPDEHINQKISEMEQARRSRNFKLSDSIRAELLAAGIIIEQTKDGVRWRRK